MKKMPGHVGVHSSNIRSVAYDEATKTLEVEFLTGAVYQYSRVPKAVHDAFLKAPSAGAFLNATIKPKYPAMKVIL